MPENKMGVMPIGKLIFNMSWPAILSMLMQAMYNVVDSFFVSRLGEDALAAVTYVFPFQFLMISVAVGTGVGIVCLLSAIRQGQVCANGIVGISQGHDVQTNTLIYAALPEFYAILGLVGALMLVLAI